MRCAIDIAGVVAFAAATKEEKNGASGFITNSDEALVPRLCAWRDVRPALVTYVRDIHHQKDLLDTAIGMLEVEYPRSAC